MPTVSTQRGCALDWQQVKTEFEWDGGWRDLYILNADIGVWQSVIDALRSSDYPLLYCHGYYWERPKHLIYRLDQEMARAGIAYYPEYRGRWRGFTIYVTAGDKEKVGEMIARLVGRPGG